MENNGKKSKVWYDGKFVEVEDVTPTWESVLPILIETAHTDNSRAQLFSMARVADKYNKLDAEYKETMEDTILSFEALLKIIRTPHMMYDQNILRKLKAIEDEIKAYRDQRLLERKSQGESQ